jgi:glutathione peroxidase
LVAKLPQEKAKVTAMENALFEGVDSLAGGELDAAALDGRTVLVVNVASRCGLTPQYEGLEALQKRFGERGFTVLGDLRHDLPDDREARGERGRPPPALRGADRDPRRRRRGGRRPMELEKFLIAPSGEVSARFRPTVTPESDEVVGAIEAVLDGSA